MKTMKKKLLLVVLFTMFALQSTCSVFAAAPIPDENYDLHYRPSFEGHLIAPNNGGVAPSIVNIGYDAKNPNANSHRQGVIEFDTNEAFGGKTVVQAFDFTDGAQGVAATKGASGTVSDGIFTLSDFQGTDVRLETPDNMTVDASKVSKLVIRLKNNTNVSSLAIFFKANGVNYSSAQKFSVPISTFDQEFKEYTIAVTENPNWTGTVQRLRFDCGVGYSETEDAANTMEFDSISFVGEEMGSQVDFVDNDYTVTLRIHAASHSSLANRNFGIYGLPAEEKALISSNMKWNTAEAITKYDKDPIYNDKFPNASWFEVDVTDYVKSQTDGVYAFKIALTSTIPTDSGGAAAAYFTSAHTTQDYAPQLLFTKTATGKANTFKLSDVEGELGSGATISNITIDKNKDYSGSATMVFAVYDKATDALLDVYVKDITADVQSVSVGDSVTIDTDFVLPEHDNMKANVYFWDSLDQLKPLSLAQAVR